MCCPGHSYNPSTEFSHCILMTVTVCIKINLTVCKSSVSFLSRFDQLLFCDVMSPVVLSLHLLLQLLSSYILHSSIHPLSQNNFQKLLILTLMINKKLGEIIRNMKIRKMQITYFYIIDFLKF